MREADLMRDVEMAALADAPARGRPLAHAVHREDRGLLKRRREECGGRVRLVVFGEKDLAFEIKLLSD